MARIKLTDRFIKSRHAARTGKRVDFADAVVPGLVLRVTDRGHKSFALYGRFPLRPGIPTRRALGDYGALSLSEARDKARTWLDLIEKGTDPQIDEARRKAAELRRQVTTFAAVADAFIDGPAKKLAKHREARKIIETEFKKRWANRPVTEISALDVSTAIE